MPSRAHRMLTDLIGRKMEEKGYLPVAYDGRNFIFNGEKALIPPRIGKHRPDVLGINPVTNTVCIGEAKTENDLSSDRTKEQFLDYANIIGVKTGQKVELIIGVMKNGEQKLLELLERIGLMNLSNVSHIVLPEELVEDDKED